MICRLLELKMAICWSKKYIANSIEAQKIDIEIFFFQDFQKKSVGSAVKNRVGRVTVNTTIFFFGLIIFSNFNEYVAKILENEQKYKQNKIRVSFSGANA